MALICQAVQSFALAAVRAGGTQDYALSDVDAHINADSAVLYPSLAKLWLVLQLFWLAPSDFAQVMLCTCNALHLDSHFTDLRRSHQSSYLLTRWSVSHTSKYDSDSALSILALNHLYNNFISELYRTQGLKPLYYCCCACCMPIRLRQAESTARADIAPLACAHTVQLMAAAADALCSAIARDGGDSANKSSGASCTPTFARCVRVCVLFSASAIYLFENDADTSQADT